MSSLFFFISQYLKQNSRTFFLRCRSIVVGYENLRLRFWVLWSFSLFFTLFSIESIQFLSERDEYGNVIKNIYIYKRKMCNAKESFVESRHFQIWRRTEIHSDFFLYFLLLFFALMRLYRLYFILGCVYKMRVTK